MKRLIVGLGAALLCVAQPLFAQESRPAAPVAFEAGVVLGVVQPNILVGVVAGPWSVRASGGAARGCNGQQLNAGRVLRDQDNAKHTIGVVWARFHNGCYYGEHNPRTITGQYVGLAYDFQVRGFFLEFGPAFGARNPVGVIFGSGPLDHVYGQIGYVYRFGKKYVNDEE
jgi:hypothetical protein